MLKGRLNQLAFVKSLDKKLLIDFGVRYIVLICFFLFVLTPSIYRLNGFKSNLNQKRSELLKNRTTISEAFRLEKNRGLFQDQIRLMEERFFLEKDLTQLLSMFSDLAKKHNLQMTASKPLQEIKTEGAASAGPPKPPGPAPAGRPPIPSAPPKPDFYLEQKFDVELTGGYHALGRFLTDLRHYPKLFHVRKLSIAGSGSMRAEHQIQLTLTVFSKTERAS